MNKSRKQCTYASKHTCSGNRMALVLVQLASNDKCRCIKMLKYAWLIYLAIWCVFMGNKFLERARHTHKMVDQMTNDVVVLFSTRFTMAFALCLSVSEWVYVNHGINYYGHIHDRILQYFAHSHANRLATHATLLFGTTMRDWWIHI